MICLIAPRATPGVSSIFILSAQFSFPRAGESRSENKLMDDYSKRDENWAAELVQKKQSTVQAYGVRLGSSQQTAAAPLDRANFTGLVLGCIEAKFCK